MVGRDLDVVDPVGQQPAPLAGVRQRMIDAVVHPSGLAPLQRRSVRPSRHRDEGGGLSRPTRASRAAAGPRQGRTGPFTACSQSRPSGDERAAQGLLRAERRLVDGQDLLLHRADHRSWVKVFALPRTWPDARASGRPATTRPGRPGSTPWRPRLDPTTCRSPLPTRGWARLLRSPRRRCGRGRRRRRRGTTRRRRWLPRSSRICTPPVPRTVPSRTQSMGNLSSKGSMPSRSVTM